MIIKEEFIKVNFTKGRNHKIDMIVIHVMEGDLPDFIKNPYTWFQDPSADASAHFGVSRQDEPVRQWVRIEDQAWANGKVVRPTAKLVKARAGINPNEYTVSIENEGSGRVPPTPIQILRNVELIRRFNKELDIPINRDHIVRHDEIRADKSCPGMINVDDLVKIAKGSSNIFAKYKIFRRGDRGKEVELLHDLFVSTRYMTQEEVDTGYGIFGPRTDRAFGEFLNAHGEK